MADNNKNPLLDMNLRNQIVLNGRNDTLKHFQEDKKILTHMRNSIIVNHRLYRTQHDIRMFAWMNRS